MGNNFGRPARKFQGTQETGNQETDSHAAPVTGLSATGTTPSAGTAITPSTRTTTTPSDGTTTPSSAEDTNTDDSKLKPDDLLKKLWKNQFFQDELSKFLDWEHRSHINNHRHLAEVFHIPEEVRDSISNSQMISRSEKLLDDIQTKYPKLTIKDLCEYFSLETWHLIQNAAVPEGKFTENDFVFKILNNDLDLKTSIIIELDSKDLWKKVADQLNITEWIDPARNFFDVLGTQFSGLRISKLKDHLRDLDNNMLEEMEHIPDESLLSELESSHAALMCEVILPTLNAPGNNLLYKLAEKFQKDGCIINYDIVRFRVSGSYESPTVKMMDYALRCQPIQYKIQDLVDRLEKIGRVDCCKMISKYVKGLRKYQEVGQAVHTVN